MRTLRLRSATVIGGLIISLSACQPAVTPIPNPTATPIQAATATASTDLSISATNMGGAGLPAGSSTSFALTLNYPAGNPPQAVVWETQNVATGITAAIVGATAPWQRRLLITSDGTLAAGSYALDVVATADAAQSARVTVTVDVTTCVETASGSSTQAINSNLVELITAGKPAVEHGLLVPVQICGSGKHLSVTLTSAMAEDGSTMTTLPAFYVFRSEVWPAPDHITAHGLVELFNVQVPTIAQGSSVGQLDADVGAGLYLLIFERDRFGATLTPQTTPASVTYTLAVR